MNTFVGNTNWNRLVALSRSFVGPFPLGIAPMDSRSVYFYHFMDEDEHEYDYKVDAILPSIRNISAKGFAVGYKEEYSHSFVWKFSSGTALEAFKCENGWRLGFYGNRVDVLRIFINSLSDFTHLEFEILSEPALRLAFTKADSAEQKKRFQSFASAVKIKIDEPKIESYKEWIESVVRNVDAKVWNSR